jgi:hypothetical protein
MRHELLELGWGSEEEAVPGVVLDSGARYSADSPGKAVPISILLFHQSEPTKPSTHRWERPCEVPGFIAKHSEQRTGSKGLQQLVVVIPTKSGCEALR